MRSAARSRDLERAVTVREYRTTEPLAVAGATLRFSRTRHSAHSYAMRIADGDRVLVFTGDASLTSDLVEHARDADLLLREATYAVQTGAPDGIHMTAAEAACMATRRRRRPAGADAPRGRGPGGVAAGRPGDLPGHRPGVAGRGLRRLNELLTNAVPGADAAGASMRLRALKVATDYHLSDGRATCPAVSRSGAEAADERAVEAVAEDVPQPLAGASAWARRPSAR